MTPFNEVFTTARQELGLSVKGLANRTGFTTGMINYYEEIGGNPTTKTLFKYVRSLNLKISITSNGVSIEGSDGSLLLNEWIPDD